MALLLTRSRHARSPIWYESMYVSRSISGPKPDSRQGDMFLVYARTPVAGSDKSKVSLFLVEKVPRPPARPAGALWSTLTRVRKHTYTS